MHKHARVILLNEQASKTGRMRDERREGERRVGMPDEGYYQSWAALLIPSRPWRPLTL